MNYHRENLGEKVTFLLPSLKIKDRGKKTKNFEEKVHRFLIEQFGGYTATAGNVFGYWKTSNGDEVYGEHLEYQVSLLFSEGISVLEKFLAEVAFQMGEKSVYLTAGKDSWLLVI